MHNILKNEWGDFEKSVLQMVKWMVIPKRWIGVQQANNPSKGDSKNTRTTSIGMKGYLPNEFQPNWTDLTNKTL